MSIFKSIPKAKLKRNTFNLSHDVKLTTEFGRLTPILCEPVVPGDTWKVSSEVLIRVAPLLAPLLHRVNVYIHYFFVPNRLIWDNWQRFITGGETGQEEPAYPRISLYGIDPSLITNCSLADYLGFPTVAKVEGFRSSTHETFDALPFRAYQLIYNEFYRDENLQDEIDINKWSDGNMSLPLVIKDLMSIRYRKWEKDYFTSALPFTQRGDATTIGLYGKAPVVATDYDGTETDELIFRDTSESDAPTLNPIFEQTEDFARDYYLRSNAGGRMSLRNAFADLSRVNATTINELRRAVKLQEYKEVLARSGSRYIEVLKGLFGVVSSDARLQRPEFLGGGKASLSFGEVLQTSETTEDSPLANYAGKGGSYGSTNSFKRFFEEHGFIFGIMSVMPKPGYMNGLPRKYYKFDRFDHYIPQFANLGEQSILKQELYFDFNQENDDIVKEVFGYTPRYAEYKYLPNRVSGNFKDNLDYWHLAREFGEPPELNESFITLDPQEVDRAFAVVDSDFDHLFCMVYNNIRATRAMPKFGVPLI